MNASTPRELIRYTYFSGRPGAQVDEKLSIYPDANVWYWSLAATLPEARNRIGTFRTQLTTAERAEVEKLAADLVNLPVIVAAEAHGAPQLSISATSNGREKTHSFLLDGAPLSSGVLKRAKELGDMLIKSANELPLSVARLVFRPQQGKIPPNGSTGALFIMESIGSQELILSFQPESFAVDGTEKGGASFSWTSQGKKTMGLVDADANLVDGINVPAHIKPATKATAAFINALSVGEAGTFVLRGRVEGVVSLHYPGLDVERNPRIPFWLVSPPANLVVG